MSDFPAQLGDLGKILQRRRIAVGIDNHGQLVLARPDSIHVDFSGDSARKQSILGLVDRIEADNADVVERYEPGATDVLTVRVPTAPIEISNEERWPLDVLNSQLAQFGRNGVGANLRHVFLGANSTIPAILGGAMRGAAISSGLTTMRTPEGRAVVLSTAEPCDRPEDLRDPLNVRGHRRPRVLILDSGLCTEAVHGTRSSAATRRPEHRDLRSTATRRRLHVHLHDSWEANSQVDARDDEDEPDDDSSGTLDFEAGHGTFITGIVRQVCPDAEIHPAGVLSSFGEGDTANVLATFHRMNKECGPFDLVVMSFGAHFANDDSGLFGIRLTSLLGEAVGIAAAGNMRSCRPYFPAAVPGVIGVGALDSGGRAWFSNFGSWVDACAPAVNVVSTFFNDFTETIATTPRRRYREWARWSGTSFAAPKVAGAIAQEMYVNQISAKEAWRRLSSSTHLRMPDLGVVFNV